MDILDLATRISTKMPAYNKKAPPTFCQTSMSCGLERRNKKEFAEGAMRIIREICTQNQGKSRKLLY
jgi:hypothetical protein